MWHLGMRPALRSAWYLLNHSRPAPSRQLYCPEQWYYCHDWRSIGQRGSMAEWTILVSDELVGWSYQEREVGNRRMSMFNAHLNPRALPRALL